MSRRRWPPTPRLSVIPILSVFQAASPLEEISMLNIGSRPARRFGAKSLADLRAIHGFSLGADRHAITSWVWRGLRAEGLP